MHFTPELTTALLLTLTSLVHGSPLRTSANPNNVLKREFKPEILNCNDAQKKHITESLSQVTGLAVGAYGVLTDGDGWKTNKGYTHYFKNEDYDKVKAAYQQLMGNSPFAFKIRCAPESECVSGSFGFTDPTKEDFEGHGHTKGVRVINLCPPFFTDKRTTGPLPPANDEEGLKKYCEFKESKKLMDFECGGHTLLHEMSHLDSFGVAAGYPEVTHTPGGGEDFEYKYHGTVDWNNKGTAGNARTLKTSKAKNKPETWQNAESLAAAATEMGAMWRCDLSDIPI
ncbi:hypothetical protein K469DRAFT_701472 [Zopfia rhizophila CBS 207.26]|uniref:Lysine-specific metallo-endopeptidase domain-containing protein n=1 Tax=Zopfia rhizophila CBS 207.26 TaxID=1314779 RepID=A0A6A6D8M0_9PEZI|nr:hypothetical protein K469DRAFT_701472 [Zopfia rhizophila CBS 207.26]